MKNFVVGGGGGAKQGVLWKIRKWRTANFLTWFTYSAGKYDAFSFVNLFLNPIPPRATAQSLLNIKAFVPLFLFSTVYACVYVCRAHVRVKKRYG